MAAATRPPSRNILRMCAALGVALLTSLGFASTANAVEATSYVALGDSYSSGVGAGDYGDSGGCKRSANAYGQLYANAHSGTTFTFLACSGAKTGDVLTQIDSMPSDATLVTLTVGGNDAGFTDVITTCTLNGDDACNDRVNTAKSYVQDTLPALLDKVYAAVKSKAPDAKLVVLSYPRFYTVPGSCNVGLSDAKRSAINSGADTLASVLSSRASAAGAQFVDVRSDFDGHNICSSASDYLHSLTYPVDESYHPTAAGQRGGYYTPLTSALG